MTSSHAFLEPELMDVVRLFEGADALEISHAVRVDGKSYTNRFTIEGEERVYADEISDEDLRIFGEKSVLKRTAKRALYFLLSEYFCKTLPWGSLTGIRPTRLAYTRLEHGLDFGSFFDGLGVSKENTDLVKRVIDAQKDVYEKRDGNVDLYVSLPFCPTRCSYCSFVTAPIASTRKYIDGYIRAIGRELAEAKPLIGNLRSVYIGGGTPFALEAEELERVFRAVAPLRTNGCEYTVEAGRPDVFTEEKLALCKKYGVTRICINAQSFWDRTLNAIGRKHTGRDVISAFETARPYGFIINCDLIAGLTGESVEEFRESVTQAILLAPENITVHTLCLKKGARLKEEVSALGEEGLGEMIAFSREKLTEAGYEPYYLYRQKYMAGAHENVGWTKRGCASVYNIDVMEEIADNLAVGANAVSKKLFLSESRIERMGSPKDIPTYLNKVEKIIEDRKKLYLG